jgi:hypothetical protein
MNVWVTTNGTILNNRIIMLLNRIRFNITVSIDSLDKETYEKIRVNSNFERMMDNFKRFLRYTKAISSDFTVNICPMTFNWRSLPDIVKWGCNEGFVVNIIPVRYPENLSLSSFYSNELDEIIDYFRSAEINAVDKSSERNKKNFQDYIGFVEQWRQYKKEIEATSEGTEKLQPLDKIRKRFRTSLNLSSMTDAEKESKITQAMDKLLRLNAKFEKAHPYFKEAVWKLAFQLKPDELLAALVNLDDDRILAQGKIPVGEEIDRTREGDSAENIHYNRLKLYLEYCVITGTPQIECKQAMERWKNNLLELKSKNHSTSESLINIANKNKIALLGEALLQGEEKTVLNEWINAEKLSF